jgi:hypothetical protein
LFFYYFKTLLFLPNKISKGKSRVYDVAPIFAMQYGSHKAAVEEVLLELGGSNIIKDSERALVALARVKEAV